MCSAEPPDTDVAEVALLEGGTLNQASMLDTAHDIRKGAPPGRQPGSPVQAGSGELQHGAALCLSLEVHPAWCTHAVVAGG